MPRTTPFQPLYDALPQPKVMQGHGHVVTDHTRSSSQLPIGDVSLDAYTTDPGHCHGCAAHADPDCLCDVDISKTAGMTFDNPPPEFFGALDVQTILASACRIWINYDLNPNGYGKVLGWSRKLQNMSEDEMSDLVALVKTEAPLRRVTEEFDITRDEFAFLRRMCEVTRPSGKGKALSGPMRSKLFRLNAQGLTIPQIILRVEEEEGVKLHYKTVRRIFAAADVAPNPVRPPSAAA